MTPDDERIEQIIGTGTIYGHENINETVVNFQLPDDGPGLCDNRDVGEGGDGEGDLIDVSIEYNQQDSLPLNNVQQPEEEIKKRAATKRPRVRLARLQNAIKTTDAVAEIVKENAKQKQQYQSYKIEPAGTKNGTTSANCKCKRKKS